MMKIKISVGLIFFSVMCSFSQDSLYFFKKDTLFITYEDSRLDLNIRKNYIDIKSSKKTNQRKGLITVYNLLDNINMEKKREFNKRVQNTPGLGASSNCDECFGIYFRHSSAIKPHYLLNPNNIKEDYVYKMFENRHLKKENVTYNDSLTFDKKIFNDVFKRYNPPSASVMYTKKELLSKQTIDFDGSAKVYAELKELVKKPMYIFILDKEYQKEKYGVKKGLYYIFNEVYWVQPRVQYIYEK